MYIYKQATRLQAYNVGRLPAAYLTSTNHPIYIRSSLTPISKGGHICRQSDQHLRLLLHSQPRESQEDQLPFPAHAGVCRAAGGHRLCPGHPQHAGGDATAHLHHHAGHRHGDGVCVRRAHHTGVAAAPHQVSVLSRPPGLHGISGQLRLVRIKVSVDRQWIV